MDFDFTVNAFERALNERDCLKRACDWYGKSKDRVKAMALAEAEVKRTAEKMRRTVDFFEKNGRIV
jgi:hypothetical protein